MKLLLSTMALLVSFSANSATIDLGPLTPLHLEPFNVEFTGDVQDIYTFNVTTPFSFTSSVIAGGIGFDDLTTSLTSTSFVSVGDNTTVFGGLATQSTLVESFLGAGSYSFSTLIGTTGLTDGSYFGNFTIAATTAVAAVPEPETYAMFLAGLGLLGFASRRRQQ